MAEKKKWMQEAFAGAKGQLHKTLGVKKGEKIPAGKLEKATHSKNPLTKRRAVLAETARRFAGKRKG
jgi:hypothetical protein